MRSDADGFAELVVLTIKSALGPVLERVAAAETALTRAQAIETTLTELRDRLVVMETKASQPSQPDAAIGDLRERVVAVETKAAQPVPVVASIDDGLAAVRDRLMALETKVAQPLAVEAVLSDVKQRVEALQTSITAVEGKCTEGVSGLRERVAVVEVRAQVPGPSGHDGAPGKDGQDGLGFDDVAVDFDGDRTLSVNFVRGLQRKSFPIPLPFLRFQGVYQDGQPYTKGDTVTWAGSLWHCQTDTATKPGDGSKDWTLCAKRGRDGKDGRDGHDAVPVVSVGSR